MNLDRNKLYFVEHARATQLIYRKLHQITKEYLPTSNICVITTTYSLNTNVLTTHSVLPISDPATEVT
jgi:hypothetical protein